ncbi:MAG TPA: helix-turn-helix transcriptional regulator [Gemmataceae bacterium]|nr:helix-turn-helix transcriptional regulator [Gemmataceae bacterium]
MKKDDSQQCDPAERVPLLPAVFHIMLALAEGDCHGYGIMQEVERLTDGQIHLGPGTLYRSIQRMLVDGFIEELDNPDAADADRRRCYRLTAFGRRVAREEARRLATLVKASLARGVLPRQPARAHRVERN